jgi:hypothetical protein
MTRVMRVGPLAKAISATTVIRPPEIVAGEIWEEDGLWSNGLDKGRTFQMTLGISSFESCVGLFHFFAKSRTACCVLI